MKNIVVIIETSQDLWCTPTRIANTCLNRFVVDEEDACEVIAVFDEKWNPFELLKVLSSNNLHLLIAGDYFLNRMNHIKKNARNWMKQRNIESLTVSLLKMTRECFMTPTEMSRA